MSSTNTSEEFRWRLSPTTAFEGAATNYRTEQQGSIYGDLDKIAQYELQLLRSKSNELLRNNGFAVTARRQFLGAIGPVNVIWKNTNGKTNKKMQKLWEQFAANPTISGHGNLQNVQSLWKSELFKEGEVFTRLLVKKRKNIAIPLAIQVINANYLNPRYEDKSKEIKFGIQFKDSTPTNYFFNKKRPTTSFAFTDTAVVSETVAIPSDEILHIFNRLEAGQWRGIPELSSVILTLYTLADLVDATVNKQLAAKGISWVIENTNPGSAVPIGILADMDNRNKEKIKVSKVAASGVHYLNSGEKPHFYEGDGIGNNLDTLVNIELAKVAMSVGVYPALFTGNIEKLSFSALKFVVAETTRLAEQFVQLNFINLGIIPLCNRFKELAVLQEKGIKDCVPSVTFSKGIELDPLVRAQTDMLEVSQNLNTYERVLEKRDLSIEEMDEDIAIRKEHGITFNTESNTKQVTNINPNPDTVTN